MSLADPDYLPSEKLHILTKDWLARDAGRYPAFSSFLATHECIALAIEKQGDQAMLSASGFVVDRLIQVYCAWQSGQWEDVPFAWQVALVALTRDEYQDSVICSLLGYAHLAVDLRDALQSLGDGIAEESFFAVEPAALGCLKQHFPTGGKLPRELEEIVSSVSVKALRTYYFYRWRNTSLPKGWALIHYHLGSVLPQMITQTLKLLNDAPRRLKFAWMKK